MFCRLCHKKIPVFRAWLCSAEFCCEEHAKAYSEMVLARVTSAWDENAIAERAAQPPPELEPDEPMFLELSVSAAVKREPEASDPPTEAFETDPEDLWRLADQIARIDGPDAGEPSFETNAPAPF
jgi:hypothetical protein